jgi:hypothetical protein
LKSKDLVASIDKERSQVGDGRLDERGERVMRGENTEMGLGMVGGIGGKVSENEMEWSESRAGWSLATTTHFTWMVKRRELV